MKSKNTKTATVPRVGHIQYLNCLPLYYGLEHNGFLLDIKLIEGKPTQLSELLLGGKLDLAPIPSIEYGRNFHRLKLLSDISISSDGEVKSIILVSKVPVEQLNGKTVSLTSASATSQVLVKLILSLKYKVNPQYLISDKPVSEALKKAEAALAIGDEALNLYYQTPAELFKYDLGKEWKEATGHKMVYAVWAVRQDFAKKYPGRALLLDKAFSHSIAYSKKCLDNVAGYGAAKNPLSKSLLKSYFETLRFDFGRDYQQGLLYYFDQALKFGYLNEMPILNFC